MNNKTLNRIKNITFCDNGTIVAVVDTNYENSLNKYELIDSLFNKKKIILEYRVDDNNIIKTCEVKRVEFSDFNTEVILEVVDINNNEVTLEQYKMMAEIVSEILKNKEA